MQKRFHLIVVSLKRIVSYFATMGSTIQPGSIFVWNPQRRQSGRASPLSALKLSAFQRSPGHWLPSLETMSCYLRTVLTCSWLRKNKRVSLHNLEVYRQEMCRHKRTIIFCYNWGWCLALLTSFIWVKLISLISRHCSKSVFIVWTEIP